MRSKQDIEHVANRHAGREIAVAGIIDHPLMRSIARGRSEQEVAEVAAWHAEIEVDGPAFE
jgi:cytochrome c553